MVFGVDQGMGMGMRASRKTEIYQGESGTAVGIYMEADFTAEHEWGIQGIKRVCGMNDRKHGVDRRRVRNTQGVYWSDKEAVLVVHLEIAYSWRDEPYHHNRHLGRLEAYRDADFHSAWGEDGLIIKANTPEAKSYLQELYHALMKKDGVIIYGGKLGFLNGGLFIGMISRMSDSEKQRLRDVDIDSERLQKAKNKTRIEQSFKAAGRSFCALSPAWTSEKYNTKYPVVFWFNGSYERDLQAQPYGWYTVEELRQWLQKGTGPVVDDVAERQKRYSSV
jgi:hypothetical protein